MRFKIVWLCLYFLVFYLLLNSLNDISSWVSGQSNFSWITSNLSLRLTNFLSFLFDAIVSYTLFFLLYKRKSSWIVFLIYLVIAIPLMIGFRFLIQEVIGFWLFAIHNYNKSMLTLKLYTLDNISFALFYSAFGLVFFFIQAVNYSKLQQKELDVQTKNMELAFLHSQINPHFLFNSLNNIYSLVYHKSEKALPVLNKLSHLLRYMIYQAKETVLLKNEISYLRDYIDLQLMRFDYLVPLDLNFADMDRAYKIAPFLLMPFVENAIKHGYFKDKSYPLIIKGRVEKNMFFFEVRNKQNEYSKDQTEGIGLENIQRRLELLYPNNHSISINKSGECFHVFLKVPVYE